MLPNTSKSATTRQHAAVLAAAHEACRREAGIEGVVYTPPEAVAFMCREALEALGPRRSVPLRIIDPACGAGALLVGIRDHLRRAAWPAPRLNGIDPDRKALQIAARRLPNAALHAGDALLGRAPFPNASFDLLLANPPYIRQERIGRQKARLLQRYAPAVTGCSDLYAYFFPRALELLRPAGIAVIICPNTWLDARYGEPLQRYLLDHAHLLAIHEHSARDFRHADVNTVICVIKKADPSADALTRFVAHTHAGPRETLRSRQVLRATPKWAALYLRAPEIFTRVLDQARGVVPLGHADGWTLTRGRRTGCDDFFHLTAATCRRFALPAGCLRPVVKSPADFARCRPMTSAREPDTWLFVCPPRPSARSAAGRYLATYQGTPPHTEGEPWYALPPRARADLLLPIAFHDRFFVVLNDADHEPHQRFAAIHMAPRHRHLALALAAVLSSTLTALAVEVFGRRGLGMGVLDIPPQDWRRVLVPDIRQASPADVAALEACWRELASEPPPSVESVVARPVQRRLDTLVLGLLGLPSDWRDPIAEALVELVRARITKADRRRKKDGRG